MRGIVSHPDEVAVDLVTNRRGRTLEVRVHPDDLGKVIGRNGRTATALRTVVVHPTGFRDAGNRGEHLAISESELDLVLLPAEVLLDAADALAAARQLDNLDAAALLRHF